MDELMGIVRMTKQLEDEISNPQFETNTGRVRNWRNHVPTELRKIWATLSAEARLCVYIMAVEQANKEEWE